MQWIAPSEKNGATTTLEKRLWDAADQFRANSCLKPQEYSGPILGLIFLRFAEVRFTVLHSKLAEAGSSSRRGSRVDEPTAYHAEGTLYLSPDARYDYLLTLPEAADIGGEVNAAQVQVAHWMKSWPNGKRCSAMTGLRPTAPATRFMSPARTM